MFARTWRFSASMLACCVMMAALVINTAPASAANWPVGFPYGDDPAEISTQPDGSIAVCGFPSSSDTSSMHLDASGNTILDVPKENDESTDLCLEHYQPIVNHDGDTLYGLQTDADGKPAIVAYENGNEQWTTTVPTNCNNEPAWYEAIGPFVGSDDVYFLSENHCSGGGGWRIEVSRYDADTGQAIGNPTVISTGSMNPESFQQIDGGFVYRKGWGNGSTFQVHEYGDLGNPEEYSPNFASGETLGAWTAHPDGTFAIRTYVNHQECNDSVLGQIITYDPITETEEYHDLREQCAHGDSYVNFLPNGDIAILAQGSYNSDWYNERRLSFIRTDGSIDTIDVPSTPLHGENSYYNGSFAPLIDAHGNVLFTRQYKRSNLSQTDMLMYSSSGVRLGWWSSEGLGDDRDHHANGVGIVDGSVYLLTSRYYQEDAQLHQIPFHGVGFDWPRSELMDLATQPVEWSSYVALGDSFSSGEGVEPFFEETTDPIENDCHRSTRAYSQMMLNDPALPFSNAGFVACSGATTSHITDVGQFPEQFTQLSYVPPDVDLVTLTIGGNDVGFADFASDCVTGACDETSDAYDDVTDAIEGDLFEDLTSTHEAIGDRVENEDARILVSGYPYVLPLSAFSSPGSCTYLSFEEKEAAFNVTNQLNGVIEDAITEMNDTGDERFEYVDPNTIDSPFKDHQLCWPDSFFIGLDNENVFRYTFHPNREGQAAFAEIFQDHLAN